MNSMRKNDKNKGNCDAFRAEHVSARDWSRGRGEGCLDADPVGAHFRHHVRNLSVSASGCDQHLSQLPSQR